jgi:serine/threonine-protein kinase
MSEPPDLRTMSPERFRRIRQIFESALDRPPEDRHTFVETACGGDMALMNDVELMLAAEGETNRLLDGMAPIAAGNLSSSTCPSCKAAMTGSDLFCRFCGTPLVPGAIREEGRFRAGALFAKRFRIVAALGRGGMGEVYRANDLELGQPVALKFLTPLRADDRARERLRGEVRLARQISHPNVCRVYDIGEAHGELYLSMEYVDGEDLAALLKRIGRLPVDKGVEIARKLCAGLAAAHVKGVLHRDLKPANIMIDGLGEVRIMDFGLAAVADRLDGADGRSGTPAYMAPEQLGGHEATKQSDLYALGLVLYEMFTGKAPFEAKTVEELRRLREAHHVTTPSTLIPEVGPAVERAILRCLDPDPKVRPASALEVSALLPGGDPLAEALAAGETPSPDMVAAAGPTDALRPRTAIALLTCAGVGLWVAVVLTSQTQMVGKLPLEYPPEVLTEKAREIVRGLGYTEPPAEIASGFRSQDGYVEYARKTISGSSSVRKERWNRMLSAFPSPVSFWYRQSPTRLAPQDVLGRVSPTDPSPTEPGMVSVDIDLDGRLLRFVASRPTSEIASETPTRIPDWPSLFAAARLGGARGVAGGPPARAPGATDSPAAWTGVYPGGADLPIRVEAAGFRGRAIYFEILFPWTSRIGTSGQASGFGPFAWPQVLAMLIVMAIVAVVARHNWKMGRVDPRGAWRIGLYGFSTFLLFLILQTGHVTDLLVLPVAQGQAIPSALFFGVLTAIFYLGLEPWVRRLWPQAMITWARVLAGRWRDPVVGRDLLIAVVWATITNGLLGMVRLSAIHLGGAPARPSLVNGSGFVLDGLMGGRLMASDVVFASCFGLSSSLLLFFTLFLFRLLLRKPWLAAVGYVAFTGLMLIPYVLQGDWTLCIQWMIRFSLGLFMMLRFGLFATAVWLCLNMLTFSSLLTTHFTAWYGQSSLVAVIVVSAVALWAFRVSLGDRPLLNPGVLET